MKSIWIFFLAILWAATASAGIAAKVAEIRLKNGMQVLVLENPKAPVATFHVWYRAGSRNEPWGKSGLAHLFEHLMFKGTEAVPQQEFTRAVVANGGNYNAFTSHDYAAYFETLPSDRLEVALRLEADRMRNLVFAEKEFATERNVVMEERRLRTEDQPEAFLQEQLRAAAFAAVPYHWPVIGWMGNLERLTLEDARRFYDAYYRPSNAFLVIVGDVRLSDIQPTLEKTFGTIEAGRPPVHYRYADPEQHGERRLTVKRPAQLPFLLAGYQVPNLDNPDSYALEVAAAVLSGGRSGRFEKILVREKQLALSAQAGHSILNLDNDLFSLAARPRPETNMASLESALFEEVARLRREPVPEQELAKARNQLEAAFVFAQDSLFYQAMLLARYEILGNWRKIDEYLPAIRAVTPDDIMRVANRYLVDDRRVIGVLDPLPLEEEKDLRQSGSPPEHEFGLQPAAPEMFERYSRANTQVVP